MGNMSYCQFENTATDMQQCINTLEENDWSVGEVMQSASSVYEATAIIEFIKLCLRVAEAIDQDELEDIQDGYTAGDTTDS